MSTFRAYLITPRTGPRVWHTIGSEAASLARKEGGTSEAVDVPATKAGLIPFLNALERRLADPPAAEEAVEAPTPPPAPVALPSAPPAPAVLNVNAVCDWLMDGASQRDVELTFEALGVRFGEAARQRRAA